MSVASIKERQLELYRTYVKEFFEAYPQLADREPIFYLDKCGIMSILLRNFIQRRFGPAYKVIAGINLNYKYASHWVNTNVDIINNNINNRVSTGHAVVDTLEGYVIDISAKQFNNTLQYDIYSTAEFKWRWSIIDRGMFDERRINNASVINDDFKDELSEMGIVYTV